MTDVILNTPKKKIALYVDTRHLYFGARNYNKHLDYEKLLVFARGNELRRELVIKKAYIVDCKERKQYAFQKKLEELGFTVFCKLTTIYETNPLSLDWKSEITLHIILDLDQYDELVLCSGESCYKELLSFVKSKGKETTIITFRESFSKQLLDVIDEVKFITNDFLKEKE